MPTIGQLIRGARVAKKHKRKSSPALRGAPQLSGIVLLVKVIKPRKPCSGHYKVARVRLTNGIEVTAYIPGEGMTVQEHANVLVRGGRVPLLASVKYHIVRGVLDVAGVEKGRDGDRRAQGRSKYGTPRASKTAKVA